MPSNKSFPAILHIRDFIEHVEPDPTRPAKGLSMQLRVSLNIPDKDVQSDDVEQHDIPTLIRFFNEGNRPGLYQPNAFVYAWGSFLTNSSDSTQAIKKIPIHISCTAPKRLSLSSPFSERFLNEGVQLNGGSTLLHYRLQSTVYNSSSRTHHTFPLTAYFKNGQRWANLPPLNVNTSIFLTGRIFGSTKENHQLAVITDDIHFLPTLSQSLTPTPSPTIGKRKRQDRWAQRANPRSPFMSVALLQDDSTPIMQLSYNSTETTTLNDDDEET
ncbi:hypothetical protein N7510_005210 [Penicillium lagena]|uniref:uncharacterized protein n=1 Tax=Penicillium lagena TaxID=94218 RepID=UPI002540FD3D|nr:uncharacterized protein N7510_005210 [Penicillium lagena]KAJ5612016.1 hypothetical protein N7510_005210 [Penicillium lagena]